MKTLSIITAAILAVLWDSSLGSSSSFYGTDQESSSQRSSSSSSSSKSSSTESSSFGAGGFTSRSSQSYDSGFVSSGLGSRLVDDIDVSAGGLSTGSVRSSSEKFSSSSSSSEASSASLNKESQASSSVRSTLVGSTIDYDNAKKALQSSTLNRGQASSLSSSSSSSLKSSVNSNSGLSDSNFLISGKNLNLNDGLVSSSRALNSDVEQSILNSRRSSIIKNNLGSSEVYGCNSGKDIDVSSVDLSLMNNKQRLGGIKPSSTFSSSSSSSSFSSTLVDGKKVKPTTVKSSNYDARKSVNGNSVRVSSSSRNFDGLQNIQLNNIVDGLNVKSSSMKTDSLNSRLIKTPSLNSNVNSASSQQVIRNTIEGNLINAGNKWELASGGSGRSSVSSLDLTNKIAKVDGIRKGLALKNKVVGFTTLGNKLAMNGVNINNVAGVTKLPLVSDVVGTARVGNTVGINTLTNILPARNIVSNIVPATNSVIGITNRRNLLANVGISTIGNRLANNVGISTIGNRLANVGISTIGNILPAASVGVTTQGASLKKNIVGSLAPVTNSAIGISTIGNRLANNVGISTIGNILPAAGVGVTTQGASLKKNIVGSIAPVTNSAIGISTIGSRVVGINPIFANILPVAIGGVTTKGTTLGNNIVGNIAPVTNSAVGISTIGNRLANNVVGNIAPVTNSAVGISTIGGLANNVVGISVGNTLPVTKNVGVVGVGALGNGLVLGNLQNVGGSGLKVGTVVGQNSKSSSGSYSNSQSSQSSGSGSKSASQSSSSTISSCGCGSSSSAVRSLSSSSDSAWSSSAKSSSSDAGSWSSNSGATSWNVVV